MGEKIEILLVEDNPADVFLYRHFFPEAPKGYRFTVCSDGEEASQYIQKEHNYRERATPRLVILDLNIPKKNGKELLKEIRRLPEFEKVPVLMVSGSNNPQDKRECLEFGANRFVMKPSSLDGMQLLSGIVNEFLFQTPK